MASQIEGYEFDVFISYRQNDNKYLSGVGEGWVTEFVANLGTELEATVKGKVDIYFDKNPHVGLLETHNVDESLSTKLRCLIFIPIISQTYCDPESFAWQHEFQAFNRIAATDKFGPTIKLPNGNVSNRVLPIRIHEVDADDIKVFEAELKGKLRPIDFIFKSSGVNRPLRATEDDPLKNAHKILYRDQINKTANAVKDIISGLKNFESSKVSSTDSKVKPSVISSPRQTGINTKSIAVLPFVNLGNKPEDDYLSDGLAEHLIDLLTNVKSLKVTSRISAFQFRGDKINISYVAEKLGAGTIIEGTVHRQGENIVISVKASSTEKVFWSETYDCKMSDIFKLLQEIAVTLAEKLNAVIREGERNLISKVPTSNIKAYDLFLKGKYYWHEQGEGLMKSLTCFKDATTLDPQFALAYAGVADAHILLGYYNLTPFNEAIKKSKESALKALEIDPGLVEAYTALAFIGMCYEWNWPDAEQNFSKVFAINPNNPTSRERYGRYLDQIIHGLKEAESEPITTIPYFLKAYALLHRGRFEDAYKAAAKAVEQDPNSFMAQRALGLSYLGMEKYELAIGALLIAASLSNRHHWLLFELMGAYTLSGKHEEAVAIMEEAMAISNALPARIYNSFFPSAM